MSYIIYSSYSDTSRPKNIYCFLLRVFIVVYTRRCAVPHRPRVGAPTGTCQCAARSAYVALANNASAICLAKYSAPFSRHYAQCFTIIVAPPVLMPK
ncbi:hypothetical protein J6590_003384 [Homalodisca vitripennis]|nr:hypothetical protein J6590_003384 [Homalodisca vitripennis]